MPVFLIRMFIPDRLSKDRFKSDFHFSSPKAVYPPLVLLQSKTNSISIIHITDAFRQNSERNVFVSRLLRGKRRVKKLK